MSFTILIILCVFLASTDARGRTRTLITYNTALFDSMGYDNLGLDAMIPSRTERRDAIIGQLNQTCADVVCLQEVWLSEDVNTITKELKKRYPFSFSPSHDMSGNVPMDGFDTEPACPLALFTSFGTCLQTNCPEAMATASITECIFSHCLTEILALPQECWICFFTSGPNLSDILQRCTDAAPGPYRNINTAGLLLLSRRPLWETSYTDLHPGTREVIERGYIQAKAHRLGQIVCTHTTSYDTPMYFEFELQSVAGISSWEEQGLLEINTLVEKFADESRLFLLGDLNVGPSLSPDISPQQPEIYSILADSFCVDPIQQCTYCSIAENSYSGDSPAVIIDHIFFKGYRSIKRTRLFDDITVGNGFRLSDHFGVMQQFRCKRSPVKQRRG